MMSMKRATGNGFDQLCERTNRELVARLDTLADKWRQGCETKEELKDLVVLEQLVNTMPDEV